MTGWSAVGWSNYTEWKTYICINEYDTTLNLPFGTLRQRNAPKCVQRVQHDCFSSFNQSYHCFFDVVVAVAVAVTIREFKKRRRQLYLLMIWLVEWGKTIVLHSTLIGAIFLTYFVKRRREIWLQREPAAVNLSFSALTWKPLVHFTCFV